MKCLERYNFREFNNYVERELKIHNWLIQEGSAKDRINYAKERLYFKKLQEKANIKLSKTNALEILSWIDTLNLLFHTLRRVNSRIAEDIIVIQEYLIPFTKKRADYLLIYQNKIIIVEFSFDKLGNEYNYETKLTQAIGYKELLSNMLPQNIRLATYTFIINPEMNKQHKEYYKYNSYTDEEELANNEKLDAFASFIELFFKRTESSAEFALNILEKNIDEITKEIKDDPFDDI